MLSFFCRLFWFSVRRILLRDRAIMFRANEWRIYHDAERACINALVDIPVGLKHFIGLSLVTRSLTCVFLNCVYASVSASICVLVRRYNFVLRLLKCIINEPLPGFYCGYSFGVIYARGIPKLSRRITERPN